MEGLGANLGTAVASGVTTIATSIGTVVTSLLGNEAIMWCAGVGIALGIAAYAIRKFIPKI